MVSVMVLLIDYIECHSSCETCYNTGINGCKTCYINYWLSNGMCLSECSDGFYPDETKGFCIPCPTSCKTCLSDTYCTTCVTGFYKDNNLCYAEVVCPFGSYK